MNVDITPYNLSPEEQVRWTRHYADRCDRLEVELAVLRPAYLKLGRYVDVLEEIVDVKVLAKVKRRLAKEEKRLESLAGNKSR